MDIEQEKERILITAARSIKAGIRELSEFKRNFYPTEQSRSSEEEHEKWLPDSLVKFLYILVPSRQKAISIVECIVCAPRSKYACPQILFGLRVKLDYVYTSRCLIEHNISHGILHLLQRGNKT